MSIRDEFYAAVQNFEAALEIWAMGENVHANDGRTREEVYDDAYNHLLSFADKLKEAGE